jgi:hypothetical protein
MIWFVELSVELKVYVILMSVIFVYSVLKLIVCLIDYCRNYL